MARSSKIAPIHPGEILLEEFMRPLGMIASEVAEAIDVPVNRVTQIVNGKRNITADTAIRLGRLFGTTYEFWMNLQSRYDLELAEAEIGKSAIEAIEPVRSDELVAA